MVTAASGGDAPFLLPDRAQCLIGRRTMPGAQADCAMAQVRAFTCALIDVLGDPRRRSPRAH